MLKAGWMLPRAGVGRGKGEFLVDGHGASVLPDEEVTGIGFTTRHIY